jgi:hypothetical protein
MFFKNVWQKNKGKYLSKVKITNIEPLTKVQLIMQKENIDRLLVVINKKEDGLIFTD